MGEEMSLQKFELRPSLFGLTLAVLLVSIGLAPGAADAMPQGVRVEKITLNGAKAKIAVPREWNGRVLLFAHGFRRAEAPRTAPLRLVLYRRLLADGWMVASTAYRRNGLIVRDAVLDLKILGDYITLTHGAPSLVIVQGHSMGGLIGTLLAESPGDRYDGVLAVGAALELREDHNPMAPTCRPLVPLLFLSNRDEIDGPRDYLSCAGKAFNAWGAELPVVREVDRDGHVNVTDEEIREALDVLIDWVANGKRPAEDGDGRP